MKTTASFDDFAKLDIRVGRIVSVEDAATKKPTYRIRIDFGDAIGVKTSCGAFRNYEKAALVGRQVVAVVNLGTKKMGPEVSEVLILGAPGADGQTIFLTPEALVDVGVAIF